MTALDTGQTPKEIAADLGRSVHTIRTLIQRVIGKLECSGRQEALAILRGGDRLERVPIEFESPKGAKTRSSEALP